VVVVGGAVVGLEMRSKGRVRGADALLCGGGALPVGTGIGVGGVRVCVGAKLTRGPRS